MIEALKEEEIVNKVGGGFKLSTLIQKRMVALNAGARPLVDIGTNDKLEIIVQEILHLQVRQRIKLFLRRDRYGRSGEDRVVPVPVGTLVFDATTRPGHGDEYVSSLLQPIGTPRRNWKQTLVSDGFLVVRHPDLETTCEMADAIGTDLRIYAGSEP